MDELTQQNAALVEQATAASQAMAQQAGELNEMMGRYHLSESLAAVANGSNARPASAAAAQAPAPRRIERRSANRPWSGPKAAKPAAVALPAEAPAREPARKSAGATDSDWQEF